jgi:hypothetical protein
MDFPFEVIQVQTFRGSIFQFITGYLCYRAVYPVIVVIIFEGIQLSLEIYLVPKERLVKKLAPHCTD